jgi:hypothetical protein
LALRAQALFIENPSMRTTLPALCSQPRHPKKAVNLRNNFVVHLFASGDGFDLVAPLLHWAIHARNHKPRSD